MESNPDRLIVPYVLPQHNKSDNSATETSQPEMQEHYCSKFVKSISTVFKGEDNNPSPSKRNAAIDALNLKTGHMCNWF